MVMKKNYLKQYIVGVALCFLIGSGILTGITYAQGAEPSQPAAAIDKLTEEEKQAILAEITRQLKEIELEALRLSLAVAKLALEEQLVALQQQLAVAQASPPPAVSSEPPGKEVVQVEEVVQEGVTKEEDKEVAVVPPPQLAETELTREEGKVQEEKEKEDADKEEEKGGFLAALGPFGNLGTPELAVLVILAVMILFVVVRRLRRGGERKTSIIQPKPTMPQTQTLQSTPQNAGAQNALDESRSEFKEQIVWK